jgi:tetratricopeptide (TPR) repeat protein
MKWMDYCTFTLILCSIAWTQETSEKQKALELNNKAGYLYQKSWRDPKKVNKVLALYDEAIKLDSLYINPYWGKALVLRELGRRKAALKVLDRLATVHSESPGYWSMGGYILEKMGRKKEAKKRYLLDIAKCDTIIKKFPDSLTIDTKLLKANLMIFVNGKEEGIRAYENIAAEHPRNELVIAQREIFYNFDRKNFIKGFCK